MISTEFNGLESHIWGNLRQHILCRPFKVDQIFFVWLILRPKRKSFQAVFSILEWNGLLHHVVLQLFLLPLYDGLHTGLKILELLSCLGNILRPKSVILSEQVLQLPVSSLQTPQVLLLAPGEQTFRVLVAPDICPDF